MIAERGCTYSVRMPELFCRIVVIVVAVVVVIVAVLLYGDSTTSMSAILSKV
jgi:hypothetical protein